MRRPKFLMMRCPSSAPKIPIDRPPPLFHPSSAPPPPFLRYSSAPKIRLERYLYYYYWKYFRKYLKNTLKMFFLRPELWTCLLLVYFCVVTVSKNQLKRRQKTQPTLEKRLHFTGEVFGIFKNNNNNRFNLIIL